ncbi:MAG: hypothetical protein SGI72_03275 [Planctomycetota bacterium]|nr:hypothetical protein [Planctomycetota bacterium]
MQVRIATASVLTEPDDDEVPLLEALTQHGIAARMAAWDDPRENWDERVPTVIRSTWGYYRDIDAFQAWLRRVDSAAPLWNPLGIVRGNLHKSYLHELELAGHAVVPTEFFARGAKAKLVDIAAKRGWSDLVVKPTVSGGSFGTLRVSMRDPAAGEAHLARLLAERDVMVQRYVESVDDYGERALVWIDGVFTHAVRKSPRFIGQDEHVSEALPIAPDELALGAAVLRPFERDLLFARVDVARNERGTPMIMELELVEPSLFLLQFPPALARLADGIAARVRSART